jgi:hypothetical protein
VGLNLRPSRPGFSVEEAKELLGMCVVANFLGPVVFEPFPKGLQATDDPDDPLPNDDGRTYAYPEERIWPKGWTPGVPSGDPTKPWRRSILTSRLSNGVGVNSAIFAYNADRNAYAVAFAGTLNPGAAMQNLCGLLIPATAVHLDYFQSNENYLSAFPASPVLPAGGQISPSLPEPPIQSARVHLGYRQALESLTVGPTASLQSILEGLDGDEIDLYVTGHSLGAAVAQLFSAWVKAGGVPSKKINVKCYSIATPKSANPPMALNYALALGNDGFSYRVDNSLDTAQQLPPTKDEPTDLFNPDISKDLASKANPTGLYAASPLAPIVKIILGSGIPGGGAAPPGPPPEGPPIPFPISVFFEILKALGSAPKPTDPPASSPEAIPMNFVGMGVPHILFARFPVVYNGKCYPPEFFPGMGASEFVEIPDETTRQWWQHWPFNYAKYLSDGTA